MGFFSVGATIQGEGGGLFDPRDPRLPKSRRDFEEIKKLAEGADGAFNKGIFIAKCKKNNQYYIEKRISRSAVKSGHAHRECRAMTSCSHPNILRAYFADLDIKHSPYANLYMQYCELGTLHRLIERYKKRYTRIDENFVWKLLWDMSLALCYMRMGVDASKLARGGEPVDRPARHWERIYHRDIKPDNIFFTRSPTDVSQYPTAVLGDFGCSIMDSDKDEKLERGNPNMTAFTRAFGPPEEPRYSSTTDVYALALTIHCVCTRQGVPSCDRQSIKDNPAPTYSKELNIVLQRMLRTAPSDRIWPDRLPYIVFREMSFAKGRLGFGGKGEGLHSWAFEC